MINRALLRLKIVQIVYAFYKGEDQNFKKSESDLKYSIEKTYDLYIYLLMLIPAITSYAKEKLEKSRNKIYGGKSANPVASEKFVNNLIAKQIGENKQIETYAQLHGLEWESKKWTVIRSLLNDILNFDLYQKYNETQPENDYAEDKELWKKIMRQVVASSEVLGAQLESESIYWNVDEEIVHSFVVKTLKKFEEENGAEQELLPMYRDEETKEFGEKLFRNAIYNGEEYNKLIDAHIDPKKWDKTRIVFMDRVIMQTAVAELVTFPEIPINVTLNEYIEIAKNYSSDKSNVFVNGILDAVIKDLQKDKKLLKTAYYTPESK